MYLEPIRNWRETRGVGMAKETPTYEVTPDDVRAIEEAHEEWLDRMYQAFFERFVANG